MLRELSAVDPAYLTGLAIFSGSLVGALTSLTSAWLTKQHEARHQRASEAKLWRQRLCAQFIDEASKLYLDALVRDQAEALAMVGKPGIAFIDLREKSEREKHGVIPGSLHAPYPELAENIAPGGLLRGLAGSQRLLFYCAFGERSAMAVQAAQDARLTSACHLQGGIDAWKKTSGPLER